MKLSGHGCLRYGGHKSLEELNSMRELNDVVKGISGPREVGVLVL